MTTHSEVSDDVDLTGGRFVQVQVATAVGGQGRVGVVTTDLESVQILIVDPSAERPGFRTTRFDDFVDEVVALLPPVPQGEPEADGGHPQQPVDVPQEYSVALAHALKIGDHDTVAAISDDLAWGGVPPLLVSLATELVGSAQLVVRSSDRDNLDAASFLLIPNGWVEIVPVANAVISHRPRSLEDLRALILSAVTARVGALVGQGVSDG